MTSPESPPRPDTAGTGPAGLPTTLGALRASGHRHRHLREEVRDNLLAMLRDGVDPWPGLHGFADSVVPQLERALIAGHDVVLLGERGQGKTRLLRSLVGLLDEWTPVIAGAELGDHRVLEAVEPGPRVLAGAQHGQQVVAHLLAQVLLLVPGGA